MALVATINGDFYANGNVSGKTMTIPNGTVDNNAIKAAAGIEATKLQHQFVKESQTLDSITDVAIGRKVIHVVQGAAATIVSFNVGAITAATGTATATIDLKKNGTTMLTASITLDSSTAAFILKAGTLSVTTAVAGDVLEFHISAVSAGTGALAKGVFGRVVIREDAA